MAQVAHRLPMAVRSSAWRLHYGLSPELATGHYGAAFSMRFLPTGQRGARSSPRGSSPGGELRSRMRGGEAQALTFGDGGGELQGTAHDEVGQNGCGEGCRSRTSGNLEFASVFNIIPARDHLFIGFWVDDLMREQDFINKKNSLPLRLRFGRFR
jgi:hypothetical protein